MCRKKVAGVGRAMNTLGRGVLENHLGLSPVLLESIFPEDPGYVVFNKCRR